MRSGWAEVDSLIIRADELADVISTPKLARPTDFQNSILADFDFKLAILS